MSDSGKGVMRKMEEQGGRERTQEETLELYKKQLANANRLIRELTVEKGRLTAQLREGNQVPENNVQIPVVDEQEPRAALSLLPEEVWEMILAKVGDRKDQQSCYNTCQLFQHILEKSKNVRLFQDVYPLLMKHLNKNDRLKCRQVCKGWKTEVEKFMPINCTITLPYANEQDPHKLLLEEIKYSGIQNPFPMRRICIQSMLNWDLANDDLDEEAHYALMVNKYVEDIKQVFRDFGDQMQSLHLDMKDYAFEAIHVWEAILFALAHCRNLKSLDVSGDDYLYYALDSISLREIQALMPAGFAISATLESITVNSFSGFGPVQNLILERCSNQLKKVKVSEWEPEFYAELPWNALQELDLENLEAFALLQNLQRTAAPNLTKLTLDYSDEGRHTLQFLIQVASHFPKLNYLRLVEYYDFKGSDIVSLPNGLLASSSLKTLELKVATSYSPRENIKFHYDFLLLFPSVQTLNIGVLNDTELETTEEGLNSEFVQLSPSWLRKDRIYESNLWELMPCLDTIALCNIPAWQARASEYKPTYTRAGYNAYQEGKLNKQYDKNILSMFQVFDMSAA